MNSPFANMYLAIVAQIQAQVPAIVYIDTDLGQLENEFPGLKYPGALIDFEEFAYKEDNAGGQIADGIVIIRMAYNPHVRTSGVTPTVMQQTGLSYFDLEWSLNKALHGWSPGDDYGYLSRINALTDKQHMRLRVRELRYRLCFDDHSTQPAQATAPRPFVTFNQPVDVFSEEFDNTFANGDT